jgi:hypothetical protein
MHHAKRLHYYKIQTTRRINKKETAENQETDNITQIQLGKSKINNPNEIVNAFNTHFITVAEKLAKEL